MNVEKSLIFEGNRWRATPVDWYSLAILCCIVVLAWCTAYNRWTARTWTVPVVYGGDAWDEMAIAKTFASGEIKPILPKYPKSLGAPFVANWNDYPITEEGIYAWQGLIVRFFGIFTGSNISLLSAHVLAAVSFYMVCRILGYQPLISIAGATLFAISHFAFARNLSHLVLTFYWHVPLGLLVVWWCCGSTPIANDPKKILFCVAVAVLHAIQFPYYTGIFLQFLVIASLICLIRRQSLSSVMLPLILASIVLAVCVVMNLDTFYSRFVDGPNPQAVTRNYAGLEIYALKPVELVLPFPHRVAALQDWATRGYFRQASFLGEIGSPYLGIVGVVALGALIWASARALIKQDARSVPPHFWFVLWILLFSVVGGVNGFIGLFGLIFFRGTNRYSIVILTLVLLYLVRQLTILTRKWHWLAVFSLSAAIVLIGFWDQTLSPPSQRDIAQIRGEVLSDGRIVSAMEAKLPPTAMIFQLPVCDYPEFPPIRDMANYEHFRPYLHSRSLRFSYGSDKGRPRERWQAEAAQFGTENLVAVLESYGFSAILINKKAYSDRAASLMADFRLAGRSEILAQSPDLVCVLLHASEHPLLPPEFDDHWYGLEGNRNQNWRWSMGNAKLVLYNSESTPRLVHVVFGLASLRSRHIDIYSHGQKLYSAALGIDQSTIPVDLTLPLSPGRNDIRFQTDVPGELPANGDQRKLAFNVRDFTLFE